jgi:hypothetical protein
MKWPILGSLLACTVLITAGEVGAKNCGDDVGGQDVPCACGDTVVSDVALDGDPILDEPCPADGLLVRVSDTRSGLTVDLRGATIRGQGRGTGIWVLNGGKGGASIVSTGSVGTVDGFHDGVFGKGPDSISLVENVQATHSGRDGIRVVADGYEIRNAYASDSGRDGIAAMGNAFKVSGTKTEKSGRAGYWIMGMEATIGTPQASNVSDGAGYHGFFLMGWGINVTNCAASKSKDDGVHLSGMHIEVHDCTLTENGGDGIGTGGGGAWSLSGNTAMNNDGNGILVGGPYDPIKGAYNSDAGGNSGSGNLGRGQPRPAVQCEISGRACEWW